MIDNIIRIYRIGKELGLTKSEISSLLFFKNHRFGKLSIGLIEILTIITITFLSVLIVYSYIQIERDTYPTGSKYSSVRIKDFPLKGDKTELKFKN